MLPKPNVPAGRTNARVVRAAMGSPAEVRILTRPGRPCEACRHRDCRTINLYLVGGESSRSVASRFGLSPSSVKRHRINCLPATLVLARQGEAISDAEFLFGRAAALDRKAASVFETAQATLDLRAAIAALGEQRRLLSLQARMAINKPAAANKNPGSSDGSLPMIRQALSDALAVHPEARLAAAEALTKVGARSGAPARSGSADDKRRP